ncbi:hypothetical protein C8R43DRAFT_952156 [Mycena crocata]|nr:hypothetical protein C8R43DRAFT_952156 [Mycena crocata]
MYVPHITLFDQYPTLQGVLTPFSTSPVVKTPKALTSDQRQSILNIGRAIHTIKYEDCTQQCVFLDEKVALMELETLRKSHWSHLMAFWQNYIAPSSLKLLPTSLCMKYPHQIKNSYHQTAISSGGLIAGKYPQIVDFCNRLKNKRDRAHNGILLNQQIHRAKLNDMCAYIEEEKEAARASEEAKRKEREKAKAKKARACRAQEVDEGSVIDDKDMPPFEPSSEVNNPMIMDNSEMVHLARVLRYQFANDKLQLRMCNLQLNSLETMHDNGHPLSTQSMDDHILVSVPSMATLVMDSINGMIDPSSLLEEFPAMHLIAKTYPTEGSKVVAEEFTSELAVNDRVKVTVSAASSVCSAGDYPATINYLRLEESDV